MSALEYIGTNGDYIMDVPARDLTAQEVDDLIERGYVLSELARKLYRVKDRKQWGKREPIQPPPADESTPQEGEG